MSSLLGEAIVDAKALRESALKNAESTIIEKYSDEVKKTLEQLLEQEEDLLGLGVETDAAPAADLDTPADAEPVTEDDIPFAATDDLSQNDGDNLSDFPNAGDDVEINIDLGALQESIEELAKTLEEDEISLDSIEEEAKPDYIDLDKDGDKEEPMKKAAQDAKKKKVDEDIDVDPVDDDAAKAEADAEQSKGLDEDDVMRRAAAAKKKPFFDRTDDDHDAIAKARHKSHPGGIPKGTDFDPEKEKPQRRAGAAQRMRARLKEGDIDSDSFIDAVMEKLAVDMGAEISGWAGRPTSQLKDEQDRELAAEAADAVEEQDSSEEELNESLTELEGENNSLKEQLDKYKQAIEEIKENLYEVNLSNARLLYTNRVLRNTSLNERQKDKIVEAISGAGSVAEAKTIYETLQSTVEAKPKRSPKSLSEAIGRKSSVIRATRKESSQPNDVFSERMRRLAGIKP